MGEDLLRIFGGWTLSVGSRKKRVLTLLEELVGRGCPARSRLMDERVRNASPLVVATCRPVAPKMPNDVKAPVVPSCPRVVGDIYQPSYIHGNLAKTHQSRDAVLLPAAAAAARFRCRYLCSKAVENKPRGTRTVSRSDIDNVLSRSRLVLDRRRGSDSCVVIAPCVACSSVLTPLGV